jgi:hypothetical protein
MRRDTVTRSWGPLSCHSSDAITSCRKDLYTIPESCKCPSSSCILRHVTYWARLGRSGLTCTTVCSSSCQYPATLHSHWRGLGHHSKGHNQQREGWWHQIPTGFLIHAPTIFHFLRYLWPTDAYLYSQSCEIHRSGPNSFISIDWFPYDLELSKIFKMLHVAFVV